MSWPTEEPEARYRRLISSSSTEAELNRIGNGARISGDSASATVQRWSLYGAVLGELQASFGPKDARAMRARTRAAAP